MSEVTVLSKVLFPAEGDADVLPLFVDADEWTNLRTEVRPDAAAIKHRRGPVADEVHTSALRISHINASPMVTGRRSLRVPAGSRISLGTYFNGFPASYWRRWTTLTGVTLQVTTSGAGEIAVYRSNARGVVQAVDTALVRGEATNRFDLGFDNFLDGGWYWFDLIGGKEDLTLRQADWLAPESSEPASTGGVSVSITTLNRNSYCIALLESIAADADTLEVIDEIIVVDQGSQKIQQHSAFRAAADALGTQLRVIEQDNVGGSGGFSRGMLEAVQSGVSEFVLLLDDDVSIEPESIRRATTFARYSNEPTIVGGHMLDMYDKTKLHAYAEGVDRWNFLWGPITPDRHDFSSSNLRQTTWMHRRFDVDYNGWWMSLIPVSIIREIGLSLPVFIKWDDAEYSLRAAEHGYRTVSLPGAAVWHVSWVDKDDSRDWQAFFHARNRLVAALLHSPFKRGGRLPISNLASDVRSLLTLDYYTVMLRQEAYDSVLSGPASLHPELRSRLPEIRASSKGFTEATLIKEPSELRDLPPSTYLGNGAKSYGGRPLGLGILPFLTKTVPRHWFTKVRQSARERPEAHLPHATPWWRVTTLDSFVASNAEGSGVTRHVRRRDLFRKLLVSSVRHNLRIRRQWESMSEEYRGALPGIVSAKAWRASLGLEQDRAYEE